MADRGQRHRPCNAASSDRRLPLLRDDQPPPRGAVPPHANRAPPSEPRAGRDPRADPRRPLDLQQPSVPPCDRLSGLRGRPHRRFPARRLPSTSRRIGGWCNPRLAATSGWRAKRSGAQFRLARPLASPAPVRRHLGRRSSTAPRLPGEVGHGHRGDRGALRGRISEARRRLSRFPRIVLSRGAGRRNPEPQGSIRFAARRVLPRGRGDL